MKRLFLLSAVVVLILFTACRKNAAEFTDKASSFLTITSKDGGSGGNPPVAANLQNVFPGNALRLISGDSASIFVSFTKTAPPGWVLHLASNDPAVQVPATYPVPTGVFNVEPPIGSSPVANSRMVTVSVSLLNETKSTTFKIFPRTVTFSPPQLQSPGNGAGFKSRIPVKFTWSDNANAYYHDIQISDDPAFANNALILEANLNDPIWTASAFNGLGKKYWRVRYVDASNNFGPWSAVRNFEIKP